METVTITLERYNEMTKTIEGQERKINELNRILKKELVAVNMRRTDIMYPWSINYDLIVGVEKGALESSLLQELEELRKI